MSNGCEVCMGGHGRRRGGVCWGVDGGAWDTTFADDRQIAGDGQLEVSLPLGPGQTSIDVSSSGDIRVASGLNIACIHPDGTLSATSTLTLASTEYNVGPPIFTPDGTGLVIPGQVDVSGNYYGLVIRYDVTINERLYVQQHANFNVKAVVGRESSGLWTVRERYVLDPYGKPTVLNATWGTPATPERAFAWTHLHQGLRYDWSTQKYENRNRVYDPELMRFLQQDPLGYVDGGSLYPALQNSPHSNADPVGLSVEVHLIESPLTVFSRVTKGEDAFKKLSKPSLFNNVEDIQRAALKHLADDEFTGYTGTNNAFMYTCAFGWIDMSHFFGTAYRAYWGFDAYVGQSAFASSVALEYAQDGMRGINKKAGFRVFSFAWADSAFTPEDLVSNWLGSKFGAQLWRIDLQLQVSRALFHANPLNLLRSPLPLSFSQSPSPIIPTSWSGMVNTESTFRISVLFWMWLRHAGPVNLTPASRAILTYEALSWRAGFHPGGATLNNKRFRNGVDSLRFQYGSPAHHCLCDGAKPKPEFRTPGF